MCVCVCVAFMCGIDFFSSPFSDFRQTIFVLQGDIEALEADKADLENKLKTGTSEGKSGHKIRMVGLPGTSSSPFLSRKPPPTMSEEEPEAVLAGNNTEQSPLLLARVSGRSSSRDFYWGCYWEFHPCTVMGDLYE